MPGVSIAVLMIAFLLPACSLKPSAVTPSIVGVVKSSLTDLDVTSVVTFEDGTTFDMAGAKPLLGGRPFQGELLVAGGSGNDRWYNALRTYEGDPECPFLMSDGDAWVEPDAILFEMGLRLAKADGYVRPKPIRDVYDRSLFCVNGSAEVTGTP